MKKLTTKGLRHLALNIRNLEACVKFYTEILGMTIEWQPDNNNYYLTSGNDNLALHRSDGVPDNAKQQRLDHFGFIVATADEVDDWYRHFINNQITVKSVPRTHRDGARSFYAVDPDGNVVQIIHHPPIADRI